MNETNTKETVMKKTSENGRSVFSGTAGELIRMFAIQGYDVKTLSKTKQNRSWGVYNQFGVYIASIVSSKLDGVWETFAFTTKP
jgi:hypothetical protein